MTGQGTATSRSLGRQLKALREGAGKTFADVRDVGGRDKLWRIETGRGPFRIPDIRSLCMMYGADQATTIRLEDLARKTSEKSVWEEYSDVIPSWLTMYVDLEAAAARVVHYHAELIPGLFQTPDYLRAIIQAGSPRMTDEKADRTITMRMVRQQRILQNPRIQILSVVSEAVLLRQTGGKAVMDDQLEHLRAACNRDRIEIRVLTFASGAHPSMSNSFSLLSFTNPEEPPVAYLETLTGAHYMETPKQVDSYAQTFKALFDQAIDLREYPR